MEDKLIKVQCISTKCGNYSNLKLGKWYLANYRSGYYIVYEKYENEITYRDIGHYEKDIFRTFDERRDFRLNKILQDG